MKKYIRKTAVFLVTAVTAGTLCACRAQTEQAESPEITPEETEETMAVLPGGWEMIKDTSVEANIDAMHAFDKAKETLDGYAYEPLAVLGRQMVSGTNYCILCRGWFAVKNARPEMMLVYVYEDLDGNASFTGVKTLINAANVFGGWSVNEGEIFLEQNKNVSAAFDKAMEGLTGASYEPVAYIGSQLVSGMNYMILCRESPVVPDADSQYALVKVYEDLNGNAEVLEVTGIEPDETDEEIEVMNSQIANPCVQYDTLQEAEEICGFELTLPETVSSADYRVISGQLLEVIVRNGADGLETYRIRKAEGEGDISGDYNAYAETDEMTADDRTITVKGNSGSVHLAVWEDSGYAYSIQSADGVSKEELTELIRQIR